MCTQCTISHLYYGRRLEVWLNHDIMYMLYHHYAHGLQGVCMRYIPSVGVV